MAGNRRGSLAAALGAGDAVLRVLIRRLSTPAASPRARARMPAPSRPARSSATQSDASSTPSTSNPPLRFTRSQGAVGDRKFCSLGNLDEHYTFILMHGRRPGDTLEFSAMNSKPTVHEARAGNRAEAVSRARAMGLLPRELRGNTTRAMRRKRGPGRPTGVGTWHRGAARAVPIRSGRLYSNPLNELHIPTP